MKIKRKLHNVEKERMTTPGEQPECIEKKYLFYTLWGATTAWPELLKQSKAEQLKQSENARKTITKATITGEEEMGVTNVSKVNILNLHF